MEVMDDGCEKTGDDNRGDYAFWRSARGPGSVRKFFDNEVSFISVNNRVETSFVPSRTGDFSTADTLLLRLI